MSVPAVEFRNICKTFGALQALIDFNHSFEAGRTHALMGRNGSGKSTLIKVLGGVVQPSNGHVLVRGQQIHFDSPKDAQRAGIATVYQELSLIPSLTVAENLFLGNLDKSTHLGKIIDWKKLYRLAAQHLERVGVDIDPRRLVDKLSVGQQQILEIAKAMLSDPSILIFDEATSALATKEVDQVFSLMRGLRAKGVTTLYVTHRMSEIFEIADTCTVLRDGRFVASEDMKSVTHRSLVNLMFGDIEIARKPRRPDVDQAPIALRVSKLGRANAYSDISFDVKRGEIVGIAGILGSGRTEILRGIFGADLPETGTITIDGETTTPVSPMQMKELGVGLTPENRKEVGLVQAHSSHTNLCMASFKKLTSGFVLTRRMEKPAVRLQIEDLAIKTGNPDRPVSTLSGGNQQKIVVGKWLNCGPSVLLLDEPTRGIDVQAKRQLFEIIWKKAKAGLSIVFVSSELEEILEVTDRVIMLRHGKIVGEALTTDMTLQDLYQVCLGE